MSKDILREKAIKRMGSGMKDIVKLKALQLVDKAYDEGIYVLITDGYRSNAEQDKLYAQGRTTAGKIVTNARGGQSNHNKGIAIDFCLTNKNGSVAIYKVNNDWKRVVAIAKELGFSSGMDWKTFKDNPHLEYTGEVVMPPRDTKVASKTVYSGSAIVPFPNELIQIGSRGVNVQRIQRAVGVTPDGIYGRITAKAVQAYQGRHGLLEDGIVGIKTWNKMF